MIKSITWGANAGQTFVTLLRTQVLHYAQRYVTPTGSRKSREKIGGGAEKMWVKRNRNKEVNKKPIKMSL